MMYLLMLSHLIAAVLILKELGTITGLIRTAVEQEESEQDKCRAELPTLAAEEKCARVNWPSVYPISSAGLEHEYLFMNKGIYDLLMSSISEGLSKIKGPLKPKTVTVPQYLRDHWDLLGVLRGKVTLFGIELAEHDEDYILLTTDVADQYVKITWEQTNPRVCESCLGTGTESKRDSDITCRQCSGRKVVYYPATYKDSL